MTLRASIAVSTLITELMVHLSQSYGQTGEGGSGGGLVGNRTQTVTDRLVGEKIEANTERGAISGALLGASNLFRIR